MSVSGKVLLVDDEVYITQNLQRVIPWEELGLAVAGTAKNGRDALKLLEQEQIDLLLCDIRMPLMDGLELVREVRSRECDCDIIMLTGYQDIEYTRAAIRYGVKDYILKPIQYEELTEVIRNTTIERRRRIQAHREQSDRYGRMIDLANEKVLYDILMDYADVSPKSLVFTGKEHSLQDKRYILMVLDVDRYSHISRHWSEKDRKLWNYAVHKVIGEALEEIALTCAVVQMRDGEWCVLIQTPPDDEGGQGAGETAFMWAERIRSAVRIIKMELNIGIGSHAVSLTELSSAYKTVQTGMQLHPGDARISLFSLDRPRESEDADRLLWQTVSDLAAAVRERDTDRAEQVLFQLSERLHQLKDTSPQRIQNVLNFVMLHLLREMKQFGPDAAIREEEIWSKIEHGLSMKDLSETIREWLHELIPAEDDHKKNREQWTARARMYIDARLCTDLAVDEVAAHLGVSSSYFSLLFKQYFGETFLEYVTRQRMEKAKALLTFTKKSVAAIAAELGYSDRRYFNKVFAKYTGQKPLEFRNERRL